MRLRDRYESHSAGDDLRLPRHTTSGTADSLHSDAPALAPNLSPAHTHTAINPPADEDRSHYDQLSPHGLGSVRKNHSRPASPPPPSPYVRDDARPPNHLCNAVKEKADDALLYAGALHPSARLPVPRCCPCLFLQLPPTNRSIYSEQRTQKVTTSDRSEAQWSDCLVCQDGGMDWLWN